MPQLNPSPWFMIFLLTWTVLTTTMLNKTLHSKFPNTPTSKETHQEPTNPWPWPWH